MINGKFTAEEKKLISKRTKLAMGDPKLRSYLSEKRKGVSPWNKGISTISNGVLEKYMQEHGAWNKGVVGSKSSTKNGMWKGGKPKCLDCGTGLENRHAKRCFSCYKKWHTGDKVYNWVGGVSHRYDTGEAYLVKKWAKEVYKRDFYSCMFCGKHCSKDIQAHHIKSWINHVDDRLDTNNRLTLCFNCHLKTRGKEDFYAPICYNLMTLKDNPMYYRNILERAELP